MTSEEEDQALAKLNDWISERGLGAGIVGYDHSDPATGEQKAVFDLAWPNGIQQELSQPVAVLLNEDSRTIALASEAGCGQPVDRRDQRNGIDPFDLDAEVLRFVFDGFVDRHRTLEPLCIDNLSRNQDIAVGLQVILKPRARPTPTWTSMPERTLDFEF